MHSVASVKALEKYCLEVTFEDGTKKEIDVSRFFIR